MVFSGKEKVESRNIRLYTTYLILNESLGYSQLKYTAS